MSNVIDFKSKFKQFKPRKNYKKILVKMTDYHEIVNPNASNEQVLINAVVDIENKRALGQINELNEIIA